MLNLKSLFNTLSTIGIDKMSEESQSISATNIGVLITWIISFPYVFAFYYLDYTYLFIVNLSMEILYPTVLLFNKYRYYFGAKNWFMTLGYIHVSFISVHMGPMSGAELYFYLLPIISVFIYSRKEKYFMLITVLLFLFFYSLTQYLYRVVEPRYIEPEILKMLYYSSYGVVLSFIIAFFYFFKMTSLHYQDSLDKEKKFTQTLIDSQKQLIITTDGTTLLSANKTFFDFFDVESVENFMQRYNSSCICDRFSTNAPQGYLQTTVQDKKWIDYIISLSNEHTHKVMIDQGKSTFIFSVTAAELPGEKAGKLAVFTNITEIENAKIEIEMIHRHTRESIEYASLIQEALIPKDEELQEYFDDYLTLWQPRDTVGGDIYFVRELDSKEEILIMVIDGAGHGVPGAFVTMLVKAIENQIISDIKSNNLEASPAQILEYFNRSIKTMLKQEKGARSNVGFDGGVLYYNKATNVCKYAGAKTPLYIVQNNKLEILQGDKKNVGFVRVKIDQKYTEYDVQVQKATQLYIATDGMKDQEGLNDTRYGQKEFQRMLLKNSSNKMSEQKENILAVFEEFKADCEQSDDLTIVGLKV